MTISTQTASSTIPLGCHRHNAATHCYISLGTGCRDRTAAGPNNPNRSGQSPSGHLHAGHRKHLRRRTSIHSTTSHPSHRNPFHQLHQSIIPPARTITHHPNLHPFTTPPPLPLTDDRRGSRQAPLTPTIVRAEPDRQKSRHTVASPQGRGTPGASPGGRRGGGACPQRHARRHRVPGTDPH